MSTRVVVHDHPRPAHFDGEAFHDALRVLLPPHVAIERRPPLLETTPEDAERHAARLATTRVLDPERPPHTRVVCSVSEHALERDILTGRRAPTGRPPPHGELYDAGALTALARDLLPALERRLDIVHIVLTDRLFGTYQARDRRYHARVLLAGTPHLLSSAGIVEAPARSRGYYATMASGLASRAALESTLHEEQVTHGDARIPALLAGYALMAFAWQAFGEPFCHDPSCTLYNAHWQKEILIPRRPCAHHHRLLYPTTVEAAVGAPDKRPTSVIPASRRPLREASP